jgi:hypothetical protein
MDELKWTNGETCERSKRTIHSNNRFMNDESNSFDQFTSGEFSSFRKDSKREYANNKINDRMMFAQTNRNPFLSNNSYLDDLNVQESFLKPQNSNMNYEKST